MSLTALTVICYPFTPKYGIECTPHSDGCANTAIDLFGMYPSPHTIMHYTVRTASMLESNKFKL